MSLLIRAPYAEIDGKDRVYVGWTGERGSPVYFTTAVDAYRFKDAETAALFVTFVMAWSQDVRLTIEDEDAVADEARKIEEAKAEEAQRLAKEDAEKALAEDHAAQQKEAQRQAEETDRKVRLEFALSKLKNLSDDERATVVAAIEAPLCQRWRTGCFAV
jgi:hypothetical protein